MVQSHVSGVGGCARKGDAQRWSSELSRIALSGLAPESLDDIADQWLIREKDASIKEFALVMDLLGLFRPYSFLSREGQTRVRYEQAPLK